MKKAERKKQAAKNTKAVVLLVLVAVCALFSAFYKKKLCKSCGLEEEISLFQSVEIDKKVEELRALSKDVSPLEIRQWLLNQGPQMAMQVIASIDNTIDRGGKVRVEALHAIYSLHHSNISKDAEGEWGRILHYLAERVLHDGDVQTDFFAKSWIMQEQSDRAALLYKAMLQAPRGSYGRDVAENFFDSNPDLRKPASVW